MRNWGDILKKIQRIARHGWIFSLLLFFSLTVSASGEVKLIPGGHTIGLRAYAQGLVVTGVEEGSPAEKAGLRQGDILKEIAGEPLKSAGQLTDRMTDGDTLDIQVSRGARSYDVTVQPERVDRTYRLGAFVRDNIAGIGTVSYYDPDSGTFGALGHGISDLNHSALLPISGGDVIRSQVADVVKGVSGKAGQLKGEFSADTVLGTLVKNTESGVFGTMRAPQEQALPVAPWEQVRVGPATIRSNVSGDDVDTYDIEIVKCYDSETSHGKNMLIKITDPELLAKTGGIVQGMSGSPILQDGKLVGAVTHVLVNTPHMGYGIYMENMLDAAG